MLLNQRGVQVLAGTGTAACRSKAAWLAAVLQL
jgi:hypothetical protein